MKKNSWNRILKVLLLTMMLLAGVGFARTASAAVPKPMKGGLPFKTYFLNRQTTFFTDAKMTQNPVVVSTNWLYVSVLKRKGRAFYVESADHSGWVNIEDILADFKHKEDDIILHKNIRAYSRINGKYLGKVPAWTEVGVLARKDGWVQAIYKYKKSYWMGWFEDSVFEQSIAVGVRKPVEEQTEPAEEEKVGNCDAFIGLSSKWWVLATANRYVKVYSEQSLKSTSMGSFSKNNCIVVNTKLMKRGVDYTWIPVKMTSGRTGYIPLKYLTLDVLDVKTFGLDTSVAKNRQRIKICQYGLPYIGTRFVLGGGSLTGGIDCSTFARRAMRNAGVMVSSYALAVDLSNSGTGIKRNQLKPGDMLFYGHGSSIGHCAIYVGSGFLINASGHQGSTYPSGGIRFSKIDYRRPTACKFRNLVGN